MLLRNRFSKNRVVAGASYLIGPDPGFWLPLPKPLWSGPTPYGHRAPIIHAEAFMTKISAERAAKIGDILFRYMRARYHFKDRLVEQPLAAHELSQLIASGKNDFDEIYLEPHANPPIAFDGKADDVFDALLKKKYRAIAFWDPKVVAAWRHYVISDGPLPRRTSRIA
jgi:hypothetical protein